MISASRGLRSSPLFFLKTNSITTYSDDNHISSSLKWYTNIPDCFYINWNQSLLHDDFSCFQLSFLLFSVYFHANWNQTLFTWSKHLAYTIFGESSLLELCELLFRVADEALDLFDCAGGALQQVGHLFLLVSQLAGGQAELVQAVPLRDLQASFSHHNYCCYLSVMEHCNHVSYGVFCVCFNYLNIRRSCVSNYIETYKRKHWRLDPELLSVDQSCMPVVFWGFQSAGPELPACFAPPSASSPHLHIHIHRTINILCAYLT